MADHRHSSQRSLLRGESLESREMLSINPSGIEQAYMESINRMRIDPQGELSVLFSNSNNLTARDSAVQAAINHFNVDATTLLKQWSTLSPVAPVAWNEDLIDAALKHNNQMIVHDEQAHVLPGEADIGSRIRAEGYQLSRATENIYAFAENHIHGHAGFVIDWGEGPGGIQDPAGHRDNYMDAGVREVGISVVAENNARTDVGPFLVTQDFGRRNGYKAQLVGVVYNDSDSNGIYDPGEGLGNVSITVRSTTGVTFSTTTMTAGGYQVEIPDGTYDVVASGGALGGAFVVGNVVMSGSNVKADFESGSALRAPVANGDTVNVTEDRSQTFLVTPNDVASSGSIVNNSVTIVQQPTNGTASVDDSGRVTYVPAANFSGNDSMRYTVRDSNGATSNVAIITLRVGNSADRPVLSATFSGTATAAEDGRAIINLGPFVSDSDGDLDWSTLAVTSQPSNGTASANVTNQQIIYTPSAGFSGSDSLSFQVSDATGLSIPVTSVAITVTAVNDRPVATSDLFTAVDRASGTLAVLSNDVDPDGSIANASIQILTQPATGSATVSGSNIQFSLPPDYVGAVKMRYRIQDTDGAFSDPADVTLYAVDSDGNPWQNPVNRFDVSGDGVVAPIDAIMVINALGTGQSLTSPTPGVSRGASPFVDVAGNGSVAPIDAIQVINQLNSATSASNAALSASASDNLFAEDEEEESDACSITLPFWS